MIKRKLNQSIAEYNEYTDVDNKIDIIYDLLKNKKIQVNYFINLKKMFSFV